MGVHHGLERGGVVQALRKFRSSPDFRSHYSRSIQICVCIQVKFFCNEALELDGYDQSLRQYQAAEYWQMAFLATLSIVQGSVVWAGLVRLCRHGFCQVSCPHCSCLPLYLEIWEISLAAPWKSITLKQSYTRFITLTPQVSGLVVCVLGVTDGSLTIGDTVLFVTMINQVRDRGWMKVWMDQSGERKGGCNQGQGVACIQIGNNLKSNLFITFLSSAVRTAHFLWELLQTGV